MENKKEKEKSIVDDALLDINIIQEALQKNTKEILRSTMREEIDQIVKDYVTEERGYEEEDVEDTEDTDVEDTDVEDTDVEDTDVEDVTDTDDSEEAEDNEESGEDEDFSTSMGDEELPAPEETSEVEPEMDYDEMDMTAASDEDVIKVFKKLSAEDEVEVVSDNEVKITDPESGNEYIVNTGDNSAETEETEDLGIDIDDIDGIDGIDSMDTEMSDDEDTEPVYEITLEEDAIRTATSDIKNSMTDSAPSGNIDGQKAEMSDVIDGDNLTGGFTEDDPNGNDDGHAEHVMEREDYDEEQGEVPGEQDTGPDEYNEDVDESMAPTGTHTDAEGKKGQMGGQRHQKPDTPRFNESVSKKKFNELLGAAKKLQTENKEVKTAIKKFRNMLAESVVYNTNLTYMVKIITEHSTSKEEKQQIMKRFDDVKTLTESKNLFKTISNELDTKKPITESVKHKIDKSQSSGSSKKLNEATAYVDSETKRIKDLIKRVEG